MKSKKINKRPISITLAAILVIIFTAILVMSFFIKTSFNWLLPLNLLTFSIIFMIISIVLIFVNLRKNRKRTIAFIISSVSFFALMIFSIFLLVFYTLPSTIKAEYEPAEEITGNCVKTFNTPGEASNIFVEKNYGYIADGSSGLQIIDISDIEDIYTVGSCDTDGKAIDIFVQNNFVYIADWYGGLKIIDISDKKNPYIIGSYCIPEFRFTSISAEKDNVYVTYQKLDEDCKHIVENGIQIIDTSNKEKPFLAAEYGTDSRSKIIIIYDSYAFLICNNDKNYKSIESELQIIDISIPEKPNVVGRCSMDGYTFNLFIAEDYAYTASEDGLYIIDISDKKKPVIAGNFLSYATADIFVEDDIAYIIYFPPEGSDENSMFVVDVSLKENPEFIKSLFYPIGCSTNIFIEGDYIYITDDDVQILEK